MKLKKGDNYIKYLLNMENFGLIESIPQRTDFVLGAENTLTKTTLQENRDWSEFLPIKESQLGKYYDTYGCVTFSGLNCLEILIKRKYSETPNYSDRFSAKMSGTVPNVGNTFKNVADSFRHHGIVKEDVWPWPQTSKFVEEYYSEIPDDVQKTGLSWTNIFDVGYEWVDWSGVDAEKLWDALQYSPIQVSGRFNKKENGVYKRTTLEPNHAVTVYKGEYKKYFYIFDHYQGALSNDGNFTRKCDWDFLFGSAMLFKINKKNMLQLIKGSGADIYAMDKNQTLHIIAEPQYFEIGRDMGMWGDWKDVREVPDNEISIMKKGHPIVFGAQ